MNYVRHNKAVAGDIYGFDDQGQKTEFVDIKSDNIWYGSKIEVTDNLTTDGVSFNLKKRQILSANFFFLADERIEHYRVRYTWLDLISKFGGFVSICFVAVKWIG